MTDLQTFLATHKLRQADFATTVGTTQAHISKLSAGLVLPSLDLATRIERATGGAVPASSWIPDPDRAACDASQEDAA